MSEGVGKSWQEFIRDDLDLRREENLFRARRVVKPIDSTHVEVDGKTLVNFCSNDYLGLTHHPKVIEAAQRAMNSHGYGSGAAALISGYSDLHAAAETAISRWKNTESAVLLPSGYQANLAAIQTIIASAKRYAGGVRFLVDELAHASLIDAVRGSGSEFRIYCHNCTLKVRRLLEDAPKDQLQVIVTESIFSMDGDSADLAMLAEMKSKYPFVLLLDEAHGSGVYGPAGSGLAAELKLQGIVDVSVVTLSKALGCIGGAVCSTNAFCDLLVNAGRSYIYSTSIPASVAAAASAAIGVLLDEPSRQQRVRELARAVRSDLKIKQRAFTLDDSPIVPIVLGSETAALAAAEKLFEEEILVTAVRPPTVAHGTSRLRITLSSEHSASDVDRLITAVRQACA